MCESRGSQDGAEQVEPKLQPAGRCGHGLTDLTCALDRLLYTVLAASSTSNRFIVIPLSVLVGVELSRPALFPRVWPPIVSARSSSWLDRTGCIVWTVVIADPSARPEHPPPDTRDAGCARMTAGCTMLAKRKYGIFTAHARNRNGSGLVDLGNLRHGNGGKTLTLVALAAVFLLSVDAGRGTRIGRCPGQSGCMTAGARWSDLIRPSLIDIADPCLSDPCQPIAQALHTCSSPSARRSIRGFEVRRYLPT